MALSGFPSWSTHLHQQPLCLFSVGTGSVPQLALLLVETSPPEKGDSDSRSGRTLPTSALREATTRTTWRRAHRGLVENVEIATGYGTARTDSPRKGGEGGAWRSTAQTGSLGMKEQWRGRVTKTRFPGNGRHTDGHMPHCVEPRRTARMGSWEATGKSSQTPVARHCWVRTRRKCEDSDMRIWPGRSGDHTRSWNKSCVMPFEREKVAAQSKQS